MNRGTTVWMAILAAATLAAGCGAEKDSAPSEPPAVAPAAGEAVPATAPSAGDTAPAAAPGKTPAAGPPAAETASFTLGVEGMT